MFALVLFQDSPDQYMDTIQKLMVAMTFGDGNAAISPTCFHKDCPLVQLDFAPNLNGLQSVKQPRAHLQQKMKDRRPRNAPRSQPTNESQARSKILRGLKLSWRRATI